MKTLLCTCLVVMACVAYAWAIPKEVAALSNDAAPAKVAVVETEESLEPAESGWGGHGGYKRRGWGGGQGFGGGYGRGYGGGYGGGFGGGGGWGR